MYNKENRSGHRAISGFRESPFCSMASLSRKEHFIMDKIKKNFGFGCMRLPMKDGEVDKEQMCKMVDTFLEQGFNYFDTAHGYLDGKSELALRDCLYSLSLLYCRMPETDFHSRPFCLHECQEGI